MREYTIQYFQNSDWIRITAIYETFQSVLDHATQLLVKGHVVRIIARDSNRGKVWHTIKLSHLDAIILDKPLYGCPE